jgi:hypothetical protein
MMGEVQLTEEIAIQNHIIVYWHSMSSKKALFIIIFHFHAMHIAVDCLDAKYLLDLIYH